MNTLHRYSCRIITEDQVRNEIDWLNDIGWVVTSSRLTNRISEVALQCIYIGADARVIQEKYYSVG